MKRFITCFLLVLLLCLPCAAAEDVSSGELWAGLSTYFEGFADFTVEDWKVFIDETVIPVALMVITAIASIYIAISPVLYRIKTASARFKNATEDVNAATSDVAAVREATAKAAEDFNARYELIREENEAARVQLVEQIASAIQTMADKYDEFRVGMDENAQALRQGYEALTRDVDSRVDTVKTRADEIEQMLLLGFCNNRDLVQRGYAGRIARIALDSPVKDGVVASAAVVAAEEEAAEEDEEGEEVSEDG